MTSEVLAIPEEHLQEVIDIIRTGLKNTKRISTAVKSELITWCKEEEEYLKGLNE